MNRRNFIKITGLPIGIMALSSHLSGCSNRTEDYGWNGPSLEQDDIRLSVLAYAMLCPNPHNKQPWVIELTGPSSFDLYVDANRLLPETDPYYRQIHIGQGTFLETLVIAASGLGYDAQIHYYPKGMYSNSELLDKPVASVSLLKNDDIETDPLFAQLLKRQSNKREYDGVGMTNLQIDLLKKTHSQDSKSELIITDEKEHRKSLVSYLTQAMQIEVGNIDRDRETIRMFRFNDDEVAKYRDGFGVAQSGVSGIKKIMIENIFLSREGTEADPRYFGEQAVDMTKKAAESSGTFGWLKSKGNTRLDQVLVGREYCRINLQITAMGLVMHPMSQILQEYEDMLPLQIKFKSTFDVKDSETVQMLFRLGHAKPTTHSPRRLVSQLIRL